MAALNNILSVIPGPVAVILMVGGFIFYVLGGIRLGYGAAMRSEVLYLIDRAEHEIQGTKRGAERKAWVAQTLRAALDASKGGRCSSRKAVKEYHMLLMASGARMTAAANRRRREREKKERERQAKEKRSTCTKDIPCEHCFPGCHLKEG